MSNKKHKYVIIIHTEDRILEFNVKLTDDEYDDLTEQGYTVVNHTLRYINIPFLNSTRFGIYTSLLIQDIFNFRFINPYRKFVYHSMLSNNDIPLTKEERKYFDKSEHSLDKIILFSASSNGVGKSVTASKLKARLEEEYKSKSVLSTSFANGIRKLLSGVFSEFGFENNPFKDRDLYNKFKNSEYLYDSNYERIVARNLVCDYSNMLQEHLGKDCWAKFMANTIDDSTCSFVVIDDYRRNIEYDYLVEKYGRDKILTVHLTKDGIDSSNLSTEAKAYEGQIDPESCDIQFKFNDDWSNTDELLDTIIARLREN